MTTLEERIEALENLTPVIGDHGKRLEAAGRSLADHDNRLESLEANVANHESMIGRMVDKIRQKWGGRLFN